MLLLVKILGVYFKKFVEKWNGKIMGISHKLFENPSLHSYMLDAQQYIIYLLFYTIAVSCIWICYCISQGNILKHIWVYTAWNDTIVKIKCDLTLLPYSWSQHLNNSGQTFRLQYMIHHGPHAKSPPRLQNCLSLPFDLLLLLTHSLPLLVTVLLYAFRCLRFHL